MHESAIASKGVSGAGAGPGDPGRLTSRYSWCIVGGAVLPLLATLASIVTILEPRAWFSPAAEWRGLAPVGVLFSTTLLLIAAPLAGVAAVARTGGLGSREGAWTATGRTCSLLLLGAVAWTSAATGLTAVVSAVAGDGVPAPLVSAHVVQGAAALALALVGALAATWFKEPLDAAAFSLTLTGIGSVGVLAAGTLVERLPETLVEWAVAGSPLVAISSAAHIDVMRTDTVYQISPLAHVQVPVPGLDGGGGSLSLVAAACAVALAAMHARLESEPSLQQ